MGSGLSTAHAQVTQGPHSSKRAQHAPTRTGAHVHTCTHAPTRTGADVHTCTNMHAHTHTHRCTCAHTHSHAPIHTGAHVHTHTRAPTCTHAHMCTHAPTHTGAHVHTRTHMHPHVHTCPARVTISPGSGKEKAAPTSAQDACAPAPEAGPLCQGRAQSSVPPRRPTPGPPEAPGWLDAHGRAGGQGDYNSESCG